MVIDFHSHIFPEKIASSTVKLLAERSNITPQTDGTLNGIINSMKKADADISVILPVAIKPKQVDTINSYAKTVNETEGIISFGGIHPDSEDIEEKLDTIVGFGLKGIKLHPDYQDTFIDDERYVRIIRGALERGLLVSIHAGKDPGIRSIIRCTPERSKRMLNLVYGGKTPNEPKIIFAHSGGLAMADDVLRYLADENVIFDLAFTLGSAPIEETKSIIRAHGIDRILFATDSPWSNLSRYIKILELLELSEEELEKIKWKNAASLLKMDENELKTKSVKNYSEG